MAAMWIMIAGPYRSGAADAEQRAVNLKALNEAALQVRRLGHVPLIGVNMALPIIDVAGHEHFDALMMPISLALEQILVCWNRFAMPSRRVNLLYS